MVCVPQEIGCNVLERRQDVAHAPAHICSLLPIAVWKALVLMRSSRAGKLGCQSKVWHCGIQHWGMGITASSPPMHLRYMLALRS